MDGEGCGELSDWAAVARGAGSKLPLLVPADGEADTDAATEGTTVGAGVDVAAAVKLPARGLLLRAQMSATSVPSPIKMATNSRARLIIAQSFSLFMMALRFSCSVRSPKQCSTLVA